MATLKEALKAGVESDVRGTGDPTKRKQRLDRWLEKSNMESLNYESESYPDLLGSVSKSVDEISASLPPGRNRLKISYRDVAAAMANQIVPWANVRSAAPFFANTGTQMMMRTGASILRAWYPDSSNTEFKRWIQDTLAMTLQGLKVKFLPWTQRSGAAEWDCWATTENPSLPQLMARPMESGSNHTEDPVDAAIRQSVHLSRTSDPSADWEVEDFLLTDLLKLLDKQKLPSFDFKGKPSYVADSYNWLAHNWNPANTGHQYCLLAGVILGKLASHLGVDPDELSDLSETLKDLVCEGKEQEELAAVTDEMVSVMKWVKLNNERAANESRAAVGMVLLGTAMMEKDSPLRKEMKRSAKVTQQGLGTKWNMAHSA
jgi:hypothetical protein